jgi:nitrite reductase (NO-forming)
MPTRRELLWGMAGAAVAFASVGITRSVRKQANGRAASTDGDASAGHGPYGHGVEPPGAFGPLALDALTIPPRRSEGRVERSLTITQRPVEVAQGRTLDAWTFDGAIPGPILRVTEGETMSLTIRNLTAHPHNLHTHGAHDPAHDGWEPIPSGATRTYEFSPRPAGLYPYHCDVMPSAQHLGRGLYGALIVDPLRPRAAAEERVLILGGFDVDGDGRSELFGWNGVAGFHARHPLKVPVNTLVRLYVLNLVPDEPVATFHLHAQTFDVFRSGTRATADEHTDVVPLTLGERAVLEMRFAQPGRYMFHPHQARMAERGAMGWITVL